MKIRGKRRQSEYGGTFVEIMVAGVLLSIGLMGLVNVWLFSFRVTTNTDDKVIAYNLGRQAMERVKMAGFTSAAEGSSDEYYTGDQVLTPSGGTWRFRVTTNIVSDQVKSGTPGVAGAVPADTALRTVTITVRLVGTAEILYQTTTYLVRAGT